MLLLLTLATAALHGASTEGWDRLSISNSSVASDCPCSGHLEPIVWFGVLDGVGLGARHRRALLRSAPGASGGSRPCGQVAGRRRRDADRRASWASRSSAASGWRRSSSGDRRRTPERARSGVHARTNQGLDPADAGHDQLDGRSGRCRRSGDGRTGGRGVARAFSVPWALALAGLLRLPTCSSTSVRSGAAPSARSRPTRWIMRSISPTDVWRGRECVATPP